jgi:hypothetical protein
VTKLWVSRCDSRQEEEEALSRFLLSFKADCIPSKVCSEAAIQSGMKATKRKSKQQGPIKRKKRREREQRRQMRSVESLLRRRYSVGLLPKTIFSRPPPMPTFIRERNRHRKRKSKQNECIQAEPPPKLPFRRKRNRHSLRKKKSRQKR